MSVNGVTNSTQAYESKGTTVTKPNQNQQPVDVKQPDNETAAPEVAAVYEKGEQSVEKKEFKRDTATVQRLLAEAEKREQSFLELIRKMIAKQGQVFTDATDVYALLREGKLEVDPETRAQAQKDIAEDGYWGVEQTSERLFSFAKALTGGDPAKADEMIEAVKKGFKEATKAWGDELPEICKKTFDTTISKLEAWRDGKDLK